MLDDIRDGFILGERVIAFWKEGGTGKRLWYGQVSHHLDPARLFEIIEEIEEKTSAILTDEEYGKLNDIE